MSPKTTRLIRTPANVKATGLREVDPRVSGRLAKLRTVPLTAPDLHSAYFGSFVEGSAYEVVEHLDAVPKGMVEGLRLPQLAKGIFGRFSGFTHMLGVSLVPAETTKPGIRPIDVEQYFCGKLPREGTVQFVRYRSSVGAFPSGHPIEVHELSDHEEGAVAAIDSPLKSHPVIENPSAGFFLYSFRNRKGDRIRVYLPADADLLGRELSDRLEGDGLLYMFMMGSVFANYLKDDLPSQKLSVDYKIYLTREMSSGSLLVGADEYSVVVALPLDRVVTPEGMQSSDFQRIRALYQIILPEMAYNRL